MPDPVMNYAASLATATSPGTNIAAAAHFYQQQVSILFGTPLYYLLSPGHPLLLAKENNT